MWDVEDSGGEVTVPLHGDQPSGTVSDCNTVCVYMGLDCLIWKHVHVWDRCLGRLVCFVEDEYYCSETTTALGYVHVSLGRCRAATHTRR